MTAALTLAMLAGSAIAWDRQEPFLSDDEVRAVTFANDDVARLRPGTPLAFWVNEPDDTVSSSPRARATSSGPVCRGSNSGTSSSSCRHSAARRQQANAVRWNPDR